MEGNGSSAKDGRGQFLEGILGLLSVSHRAASKGRYSKMLHRGFSFAPIRANVQLREISA